MRVLVDVHGIVRMLLPSSNPFRSVDVILQVGVDQGFIFLVPLALRRELLAVISTKPYLSARIPPSIANGLVTQLERRGTAVPPLIGPHLPLTRDPKDNYLVAYAVSGKADYLVTDDNDLLVLDGQFSFRILRPSQFLDVLRDQGLA